MIWNPNGEYVRQILLKVVNTRLTNPESKINEESIITKVKVKTKRHTKHDNIESPKENTNENVDMINEETELKDKNVENEEIMDGDENFVVEEKIRIWVMIL
eukprot:UN30213